MSEKNVEYVIRIGLTDRYRHNHTQKGGKILQFSVQYETNIKDKWYAVVRYDCSHGFAHRDLLDINGNVLKTPLFNQDFNEALTFAESDLKINWKYYKKHFMEENDE
ncbi:MAG: hypothetical protein HY738_03945 [Bacteroidia bacterium]|nr:hypothetical protein [Bacteroidia bacterium]